MNDDPDRDDPANPFANPYAPPAASEPDPRDTGGPADSGVSRWGWVLGYAAIGLVGTACNVALLLGLTDSPRVQAMATLLGYVGLVVGLAWLGATWGRLPDRLRRVDGDPATGAKIIGYHFVPIYGFIWMFKAQSALCGALDTLLVRKGDAHKAPRDLAVGACVISLGRTFSRLLPSGAIVAFWFIQALAWTLYMIAIERTFARAGRREGDTRA